MSQPKVEDPTRFAIEKIAGEPPVPKNRLTIAQLKERFKNPPLWEQEVFENIPLPKGRHKWLPAAVLIPLVARADDDLRMLFTRRSVHLHDHAGQVSFPGGRVDLQDSSRIETALREMKEEVGIKREHIEVLGTLPEFRTTSGFRVTPVVAIVHPPFTVTINPEEVEEVFEVPLHFLMDGSKHQLRYSTFPDLGRCSFYTIPYEKYMIWGATAGMLRNFFHFMRA